jgi:hypothetical protein
LDQSGKACQGLKFLFYLFVSDEVKIFITTVPGTKDPKDLGQGPDQVVSRPEVDPEVKGETGNSSGFVEHPVAIIKKYSFLLTH